MQPWWIVAGVVVLGAVVLWTVFMSGPTQVGGKKISVDGPGARALVDKGAALVDVRTRSEFASGHIDGAINIPLSDLQQRHSEIPAGPVVLYCKSGMRSARAAKVLFDLGHTDLHDLGPMHAW